MNNKSIEYRIVTEEEINYINNPDGKKKKYIAETITKNKHNNSVKFEQVNLFPDDKIRVK